MNISINEFKVVASNFQPILSVPAVLAKGNTNEVRMISDLSQATALCSIIST